MKVQKGRYGYLKRRKRSLFLRSAILLLLIAAFVAAGLLITKTVKNVFSIFACLFAIPFAMQLATFFSVLRYQARPAEEYERVKAIAGDSVLDAEILIANKEGKPFLLDYVYFHDTGIYAYGADLKDDPGKTSEYLRNYLRLNDCDASVAIYRSFDAFLRDVSAHPGASRDDAAEILLRQEGVFRAISM